MSSSEPTAPFQAWPNLGGPALISDPIVQCLVLIVLTSVFFLLFPGVDPWFSGLFYLSGQGFPVSQLAAFMGFRDILRDVTWIVPIALVVVLLAKIALPWRKALVSPRDALFILATLAIGPGIITNLVFKNHWGRPRPYQVDVFGGASPFVGVWRITDYCSSNCSFISGEASDAVWLLTILVLVPKAWRPPAFRILLVLTILFSLNRIAFGGHFLSDVLLAWWITLLVIAVLYRVLYASPPAMLTEDRLEADLSRAGLALRRLLGRRNP